MPPDDGVRRYEVQRVALLGEAPHQNPEHTVAILDPRSRDASLENRELMAKGDVL